MEMDPASLLDRWAIAKLKKVKGGHDIEFEYFKNALPELKEKYPIYDWDQFGKFLYQIGRYLWELESAIRKGVIDDKVDEIGRRAIMVRKFNSLRSDFKNIVNKLVGFDLQEKKIDHLSGEED